ncbi:hypothetical protein ABK040_005857 [Willaertia magna]
MKGLRGDNYSTKLFLLLICLSLMLWFCGEQVLSQSRETLTRTFYIDDSLTGDSTNNNCTVLEEPCNITRAETIFVNEFNSLNFTATPSIFIYFNIISDTFDCLTKLPKYDSNKIYYLHLVFQSFNNKNEKTNLVCNDGYVFNNDNVHVQLDNVKITTPLFQVDECNFICNYCDFHSTSIISNNGYLRFINTVFDGSYIQIKNSASTDFKDTFLTSSTSFLLEEILYLNIQDSTFDNLGSITKIQGVRSFDMSNCNFNGTTSFYTISVHFSFYVTIVNVNVLNRFTIFNFGNIFSITMENITFTESQTGTEAMLVISETRNAKLSNLHYEKLSATCLALKNVNEAELFQSKFNSTNRFGISLTKTTLKIHQSDFIENRSGAIITDSDSHLEIDNCNFIRNNAQSHGGAIFSKSSTQIVIKNSKFIENKVNFNKIEFCGRRMTTTEKNCEGSGGAIYAVGLSISNCEFYGNSAVRGGAIFLESTVFDFGNNSFIKNTALFSGGAIFNLRPAESTKGNSFYVSDNSAFVYGNDFATSLLKANWTTTASIREDDGVTNLLVYPGQLFSLHFDAIDSVGNHIPVLKEKKQLTAVEFASAQTNFTLSTEAMIDTPTGIENIVVIQKGSEKLSENKRFALVIQFSSNFVFIIVDVIDCPKGNEMKQISFSANEFACLPKEKDKTIVIIASTVVGSIIGIVIGIIITYGVYKLLKRLRKLARKERAEKEMEQKLLAHQFSNSGEYYTNTVQFSSSTSLKQRMSLNTPLSQDLNYIIPVEELELKRKLGEGGNGTVFLANFHSNQVAVKLLHSKVMNDDEDNTYEREMFERECLLLNTLRHPNIVNFYGVCLTEENRYMVVEYMPKGSLDKIILSCKLVCALFCSLLAVFTLASDINFSLKDYVDPSCTRSVSYSSTNNNQTATFGSLLRCEAGLLNKTSVAAYTDITFIANTYQSLYFLVNGKAGVEIFKFLGGNVVVATAFGVDKIVEYDEVNNQTGYQPNGDVLIQTWPLSDKPFTSFNISRTVLNGTSTVYQIQSAYTIPSCCTVRLTGYVTTAEVYFASSKIFTREGIKQLLTPSSLKVEIALEGIQYSKNTSRVAIGSFVVYRGSAQQEANSTTTNPKRNPLAFTDELPDVANAYQKVYSFSGGILEQVAQYFGLPKPFFSYQTFVTYVKDIASSVKEMKNVIDSNLIEEDIPAANAAMAQITSSSKYSVRRVYFSLPDRVDNFNWDPSLGQQTKSSASKVTVMIIPLIAMLLAALFLL